MPWHNWARTVHATPLTTRQPRDPAEAARLISTATERGIRVRPLGSGHSFTGIGSPDQAIALDLSRWTGIIHVDSESGRVTAHAATTLAQLNAELAELGLAMANLGDIDRQTIAGAISTGTHGTGAAWGGIATQVEAIELILADGTIQRCSQDLRPELFHAARIGLGALGVISTVTLRCVPAFTLTADEHREPVDDVLERFDELAAGNDHFEFYWFPHGRQALVKRNNRMPGSASARPLNPVRQYVEYQLLENQIFGALCRFGRAVPRAVPTLTRLSGATWSSRSYSDRSDRVFVTPRSVPFVECEYAIGRESFHDVFEQLRAAARHLTHPVMFPVEVRVAAADDIWLSTAYRRPTVYIAVHQYVGMPHQQWFDAFRSIVDGVGGRPHWAKMHRLDAAALRTRYPKFDDFQRVRAQVDPNRTFSTSYLDRVLGPAR